MVFWITVSLLVGLNRCNQDVLSCMNGGIVDKNYLHRCERFSNESVNLLYNVLDFFALR